MAEVTMGAADRSRSKQEEKDTLMKRIDQASFAVDDVLLYLDTHPEDQEALKYYQYAAGLRREAVDAWQRQYGPLTVDSAYSTDRWSWLTEKWPWEGEV